MLFLFAMIKSMAMYFGMKGDEPIFIMKEDEIVNPLWPSDSRNRRRS